jgi:hypothetical protein
MGSQLLHVMAQNEFMAASWGEGEEGRCEVIPEAKPPTLCLHGGTDDDLLGRGAPQVCNDDCTAEDLPADGSSMRRVKGKG